MQNNPNAIDAKDKAVRQKADWLKYCLDIGFHKDDLDELSAVWDRVKDEYGNLRKLSASPSPVQRQRTAEEIIDGYVMNGIGHEPSEMVTRNNAVLAMKEYASQFYTPSQVLKMVGDAWEAAQNRLQDDFYGRIPNPHPDKTTFINNLNLK